MDAAETLLIREFDAHQERYRQLTQQSSSLQHYAIVLSAATWAWTLVNGNEVTAKILIWLPALLTLLFAVKSAFLHTLASRLYVRFGEIEDELRPSVSAERSANRDSHLRRLHDRFAVWLWGFWLGLIGLNVVAGIVAARNMHWFVAGTPAC